MPNRSKRPFDPLKSDSEDSDFDVSSTRPARAKSAKASQGKSARKRPRRGGYGADGSEDVSEESELSEESYGEELEHEEPEVDPRTGRPKRSITKKRKTYRESDSDAAADPEAGDSEAEEEPPPKRQKLVVKLSVGKPQTPVALPRRSNRARSGSVGTKMPTSVEVRSGQTRRSSRIAGDESETMVKLTDSGRHADIVQRGTRSPEGILPRPTKGGKGPRRSSPEPIAEEEGNSSGQTKEEPEDDSVQRSTFDADAEIAASRDDPDDEDEEAESAQGTDAPEGRPGDGPSQDVNKGEAAVVPESGDDAAPEEDEDEEDVGPIKQTRRITRRTGGALEKDNEEGAGSGGRRSLRQGVRSGPQTRQAHSSQRNRKGGHEESSDFEPGVEEGGEEDISDSDGPSSSPKKAIQQNDEDDSSNGRRSRRTGRNRKDSPSEHESEVADELAEELEDLKGDRPRRAPRTEILYDDRPKTRKRKPVDYRILRPDLTLPIEEDGPPSANTPSRRARGGGAGTWQRSLFSTYGPFGGAGGPAPLFGGPGGMGAAGGVDSDSSDDENMQRPRTTGVGGMVGMTPTAAPAGFGLFPPAQAHAADPLQGPSGTPANLGRIKDKQSLADADPLGVDQNVSFDSVGGLQGHIDQLKEMVALPLLYPEIFQRFHVTPPRGVLFHGPPGTGKTLLARALASSVSSQGKKVTFYMRKGADALSKWVGEAERQLRLLFDEARKTQPSIIFFDEIDGLAPVRSSKQEQIHASIVSTLLALMDGMDGRGQVIVIGATNRPDSVDPALRRPGRFDREFYFPLPNTEGRRAILDIHTKGWEPPLGTNIKDELADLTKGYGGADLRALCTEAALNAVQRRYPQIYKSNEKLQIDPKTISVTAKDFMISVKKMVPSSERSTSSGAAPLPAHVEPLLREPLAEIENLIAEVLPQKKRLTALEEAEFEDAENDRGMKTERMQQEFERSRVFRPRLLIKGTPGMGQQYLAGALLNHFEGLHVQAFDLPTLLSDSTRSSETAVVQLFAEVKRHKPSVIYIPNVDSWYRTVGHTVISTFLGLLRTLAPTEQVLLLGVLESDEEDVDPQMLKDLFGFSRRSRFELMRPNRISRRDYFIPVIEYVDVSPTDFPEPANRKKRVLEKLKPAPPEPAKPPEAPSKEVVKAQMKKDRLTLNLLKLRIQPIMDQIKQKFKKFRTGVVDDDQIRYLFDEEDPNIVSSDLPQEQRVPSFRPYEKGRDKHGEEGLVEQASGRFFYNLETVTIEKRLSNGYYKRTKDFLSDIKKLAKDAKTIGDEERVIRANELLSNVEVDMNFIDAAEPVLAAECEAVYAREIKREQEKNERVRQAAIDEGRQPQLLPSNVPPDRSETSNEQPSGAIVLGQPIANGVPHHPITPSRPSQNSALTNGYSGGLSDLSHLSAQGPQSNGTSFPSRDSNDAHMTSSGDKPSTERETQNSSFGPSAQTRPSTFYTGAPASLQQRRSQPGSLSQQGAITPLAEGSNPQDYSNHASTTSSDKRVSGSSGPFNTGPFNTQSSQGRKDGPDLSTLPDPMSGNSQFPDTQADNPNSQHSGHTSNPISSQSQPPSQQSQPPVPLFSQTQPPPQQHHHDGSIHSILNTSPPSQPAAQLVPTNTLITDPTMTIQLLDEIVERTSGYSVEQLEQVYSAMMNKLWDTRGEWNRTRVCEDVGYVMREVLDDIMQMQDVGHASREEMGLIER